MHNFHHKYYNIKFLSFTLKQKNDQHGSGQQANLEDSWFWESERGASSESSKDNDGTSTLKPASAATDDAKESIEHPRIVDSLRRSLDEKDADIQRLLDENLSLNEKIKHLHRESIEQDKRLDELDQQHNEALQNLVLIKNELQANVVALKKELQSVRNENEDINQKLQILTKDHCDLETVNQEANRKFDEVEAKHKDTIDENDRLKVELDELQTQLNTKITEITELNAMVEEKDAHSREGSDKFELIDLEKEKMTNSMEINRLQTELDEINERLSILKDIKDQYDSNVLKLGSVVSEKNNLEELVNHLTAENESLLNEVRVTRKSVEKLEVLQKSLDEINLEKENSELSFINLQDEDLLLQKEFDRLRTDKELLESTRTTQDEQIFELEEKCAQLEEKCEQLQGEYEKLQSEHGQCEDRINEIQNMHDTLKCQASDLESSLVEENMKSQKQVIDLQSALNSRRASESSPDLISFDDLKSIVSNTLSYETVSTNNSVKLYLDAFLRSVKETYQHLSDIEANRDSLMKQFESVSTEKAALQHEYKTLKADLHHYEKEVAELMKNNGILLNQLESVKAGKLETISEHNEDSILRLETQLEDTNKLNTSLQEEFNNLSHKLDESEEEKYELTDKIGSLQQQLDQMRTDDSKLEIQKCFEEKFQKQNDKIAELTKEIENLSVERDEKKKLVEKIEQLQQSNQSEASALQKLQQDFKDLEEDYKRIENNSEEDRVKYEAQIAELTKTIEELLISANEEEKSHCQSENLQQKLDLLTKEKQELVNAIQAKHNENIQYHSKIQELNQMLMTLQQTVATQTQQLAHCASCAQLTEKIAASQDEITKFTDQITFLKEKSDILTQNLLVEQSNQKILQQEKIQLADEKVTLSKDLHRLREHLIEMENAHTAEMIEAQNMLELTGREVAEMQEEARKSNTAYTSAR